MPTKAVTGTRQIKTTDKRTGSEREADEQAAQARQDIAGNGAFRRRNYSLEDGTVVHEEQRPGSKAWVEVDRITPEKN
jgi:hypothetical protein